MKFFQRWTDEDTAVLRRMYLAGATNIEIAEELGRTTSSINNKLGFLKRRERLFSD